VTAPLILLAIPSVVIGFLTIEPMLYGEFFKDSILVNLEKHPAMEELKQLFHGPAQMALHGLTAAPFWLALSGSVLAWYMYMVNPACRLRSSACSCRSSRCLRTSTTSTGSMKTYWLAVHVRLGTALWKGGDQKLIDGALVNGSWKVVGWVSSVVRRLQSGYIYHYAFGMIIGVFVLMTYFVWLNR
jgi:NADH-quinone oxidoreductase subunit L